MESSAESYTDSKDSTYQDTDDDDVSSIPSVVNSGDYSFNIQNAYELDTGADQDILQSNLDDVSLVNPTSNSENPSSISNMDVPISQLVGEEILVSSNDTNDISEGSSIKSTQLHDSY